MNFDTKVSDITRLNFSASYAKLTLIVDFLGLFRYIRTRFVDMRDSDFFQNVDCRTGYRWDRIFGHIKWCFYNYCWMCAYAKKTRYVLSNCLPCCLLLDIGNSFDWIRDRW